MTDAMFEFDEESTLCTTCGHSLIEGNCLWCNPLTPYAGTSGWSGSETSHERAATRDKDGKTGEAQGFTLNLINDAGATGLTVSELREFIPHHGTASGTLSVLHKAGTICRLTEKRDRCAVYVLPMYVAGRPTVAQGRRVAPVPALKEDDDRNSTARPVPTDASTDPTIDGNTALVDDNDKYAEPTITQRREFTNGRQR